MEDQLNRIQKKLAEARSKDAGFKVFGASTHRYLLKPPASTGEIKDFEIKHSVILPEDYVAFMTTIGNGGPGHFGGAGPQYGLYGLGQFGFLPQAERQMSRPPVVTTELKEDQWTERTKEFDSDELLLELNPEAEERYDSLFAGLMPIGTQGCNFQTMLAVNGADRGRVVFVDQDLAMPKFASQLTFLDWYEAWLDRILEGVNS